MSTLERVIRMAIMALISINSPIQSMCFILCVKVKTFRRMIGKKLNCSISVRPPRGRFSQNTQRQCLLCAMAPSITGLIQIPLLKVPKMFARYLPRSRTETKSLMIRLLIVSILGAPPPARDNQR